MKKLQLMFLFVLLGLAAAPALKAQTFTNLYQFTVPSGPGYTNADGFRPYSALVLSGNRLYGTCYYGGANTNEYGTLGTVFAINTDGTSFSNLYNFTGSNDVANPQAGLVLSDGALYGTATDQYSQGSGGVYKLNTDGSGYTNLHIFTPTVSNGTVGTNSDGANPSTPLILSGSTLFGVTPAGGKYGYGTVFEINTNGLEFTNLYSFTGSNDGSAPIGPLLLVSNFLYGSASGGGSNGHGTLFSLNISTKAFKPIYTFTYGEIIYDGVGYITTNFDGVSPNGGLIRSGKTLFGSANTGGSNSTGTVFKVETNGSDFVTLASDLVYPRSGVVLLSNTVYGTDNYGIFSINTNNLDFNRVYYFMDGSDGESPNGLVLSGEALFGTTESAGNFGSAPFDPGYGTIFGYFIAGGVQPQFGAAVFSGTDFILSGSDGPPGSNYVVLTSTDLTVPLTSWTAIATNAFDGAGNFSYTNEASSSKSNQFFTIKIP